MFTENQIECYNSHFLIMSDWYIREIQELEYMECLRTDIEKEIVEHEKNDEKMELKRACIENILIEDAEKLDYELERCKLSPRSLRLKRLEFYEQKNKNGSKEEPVLDSDISNNNPKTCKSKILEKNVKENLQVTQCISITKKGTRCSKRPLLGLDVCHIHKKNK